MSIVSKIKYSLGMTSSTWTVNVAQTSSLQPEPVSLVHSQDPGQRTFTYSVVLRTRTGDVMIRLALSEDAARGGELPVTRLELLQQLVKDLEHELLLETLNHD